MFKSTILALGAVALLGGQAAAFNTCEANRIYCGYELIEQPEPDRTLWTIRVNAALTRAGQTPITVDKQIQSRFRCNTDRVSLTFVNFCLSTPGSFCQPRDNQACNGIDSCCLPV
ncbi:hypothetical protein MAPG_04925 [Magnaporthiopsis poae ATCC 64411]|uniref:Hydrophobin n=1 Tax=Magnaporthiopsis poae (strain ATCC 64411 / 73-15) TaxID=644358 RepID=A0A0C4DY16_MAGP6|nr:hypothetical protein MAPG_04925 [Magnaporthiopsis poae ATCC 64411]